MLRMLYGGAPGGFSVVMAVTGPIAPEHRGTAKTNMPTTNLLVQRHLLAIIIIFIHYSFLTRDPDLV
jgi:hypothetical protein